MASAALKIELAPVGEVNWEEVIERTKEEFLSDSRWSQNAGAVFIDATGEISDYYGSVCHHFLRGHKAKFIINGLQDGESYGDNIGRILPKVVEVWYLDWLLNRSPYSDAFITKDAVKALEECIVVSSGDHPGNYVGGSIVSLRLLWEHTYVAQSAYDLHKAGVPEDLAFLLGHTIQVERKIKPESYTEWSANTSWHSSIDVGQMGFVGVKAFMQHKPTSLSDNLYVKSGQYSGYSALFSSGGRSLWATVSQDFPYHLCVAAPPPKVDTNPFQAAKKQIAAPRNHSVSYDKAIEVMAEWAKTHLMKEIDNA